MLVSLASRLKVSPFPQGKGLIFKKWGALVNHPAQRADKHEGDEETRGQDEAVPYP